MKPKEVLQQFVHAFNNAGAGRPNFRIFANHITGRLFCVARK